MKKKLADEAEMERRRQELLNEQDGYWRLRMEQAQAEQRLTRPAIEESETDKVGHSWSQGFYRYLTHWYPVNGSGT